jgi:hypothetical protein
MRWAQMVFTEDDPGNYDPKFWLDYFKRTHSMPRVWPAAAIWPSIRRRCLFMTKAGFSLTAIYSARWLRADAHPDWIAVDAEGRKRRHWANPELWVTCALGPMNFEFMTEVTKEIVRMYGVDGVFSNRWTGSGQCYCAHCRKNFKADSGCELPRTSDPRDPARRAYIVWHERRIFDLWSLWDVEIRKIIRTPASFRTRVEAR